MAKNRWELYSSMSGWEKADEEITSAVEEAIQWIKQMPRSMSKQKVLGEAMKRVESVLLKYTKFGALDSEPLWHTEKALRDAIEDFE